jgi:hypothetical protein
MATTSDRATNRVASRLSCALVRSSYRVVVFDVMRQRSQQIVSIGNLRGG